jgi:SAM-dependent methyltransferase
MGVRDDPLPWSFPNLAWRHLSTASSALDIATGGGERLAELAAAWPEVMVATEEWPPNVPEAAQRLTPLGAVVVKAGTSADSEQPFHTQSFDLVLARHSAVKLSEIARVLSPGGWFVTQQVAPDNLDELRSTFAISRPSPREFVELGREALVSAGFDVVDDEHWQGRMHVRDVEALLAYVRAVPWELPGFDFEFHLPILRELDEQQAPLSFGISRSLTTARRRL